MRPTCAAALLTCCVLSMGPPVDSRERTESVLRAGYAEADITPPIGGSMPGYFQDRRATGTLDPLKSKVLYLRQGDRAIAIVACDLVGMGEPVVRRIREETARRMRNHALLKPPIVWVHCSHTHTGGMLPRAGTFTSDTEKIYPGFYPGSVDAEWVDRLVQRTAEAVASAAASAAVEQKLTLHEGSSHVAHYRRFVMKDGKVRTNPGRGNPEVVRPAGEIDPRVHVLRLADRRLLTVIYGLHPDCVGGTRYSADFPHHLAEALRESEGAGWQTVFLNAACGNINHIDVNNPSQKSGPDESRRIGRELAHAVRAALPAGQTLRPDRLEVRSSRVRCRLRKPPESDVAEAEERLRTGRNPFEFNGLFAPAALVLGRTRDREHTAEIGALRLGSFALAAMPGEVFVELAREVEAGSPFRPTRTIGLTNGAMGYIPTRRGYEEGGYEAGYRSARYEPDTGHRWASEAVRMLRRMSQD